MIKSISEIPQQPMDAWQAASHLFGQDAVDQDHFLAGEAARQMRVGGWTFVEYDPETGEEIWQPPSDETARANRT